MSSESASGEIEPIVGEVVAGPGSESASGSPAEPTTELPPIAKQADERQTLTEFLDYQRTVLLRKTEGLTDAQAMQKLAPSDLTLGGLLKHMAYVESNWASYVYRGDAPEQPWADAPWEDDSDWELTSAADHSLAELQEMYRNAWAAANAIYQGALSMDAVAVRPGGDGGYPSMRWILIHLIEEYARHLGHADYLRESIDGAKGD